MTWIAAAWAATALAFGCSGDDEVRPFDGGSGDGDSGDGDAVGCVDENDCGVGQGCQNAMCVDLCTTSEDCAAGVCNPATGACQQCLTETDCGAGMICSAAGSCMTAPGDGDGGLGGALGDGDAAGDGDVVGDGDVSGDGDGDVMTPCVPEVKILIQRSGAIFESPNGSENWWGALRDALAVGGEALVNTYADTLDLTVSTFHMMNLTCPAIITDAPTGASELEAFFQTEEEAFSESQENQDKIDAPLPEAIESAVSSFSSATNRYLILAVSGNPDSCDDQDGICAIEPSIEALQTASDAGVVTKVLYLHSVAGDPYGGYEQALANAGAGEPVAELDGLGISCGTDPTYYSEPGGSAPFQAPESIDQVASSLSTLLDSIGSCQ